MTAERRDEAFEEVFDAVFPLAQRVAYRVLGDAYAAEDAAADHAHRGLQRLRGAFPSGFEEGMGLAVDRA